MHYLGLGTLKCVLLLLLFLNMVRVDEVESRYQSTTLCRWLFITHYILRYYSALSSAVNIANGLQRLSARSQAPNATSQLRLKLMDVFPKSLYAMCRVLHLLHSSRELIKLASPDLLSFSSSPSRGEFSTPDTRVLSKLTKLTKLTRLELKDYVWGSFNLEWLRDLAVEELILINCPLLSSQIFCPGERLTELSIWQLSLACAKCQEMAVFSL